MQNKNLPHIKSDNDKNYEEIVIFWKKSPKMEIIVFLKIGISRQRTPKGKLQCTSRPKQGYKNRQKRSPYVRVTEFRN